MINAGESMEKIELFYTVSENVNATTVEKVAQTVKNLPVMQETQV